MKKKNLTTEPKHLQVSLARAYKVRMISRKIEDDIKFLRKLDLSFQKIERVGTDVSMIECMNILRSISNRINIFKIQDVLLEMVNPRYHETMFYLINNLNKFDSRKIQQMIDSIEEEEIE